MKSFKQHLRENNSGNYSVYLNNSERRRFASLTRNPMHHVLHLHDIDPVVRYRALGNSLTTAEQAAHVAKTDPDERNRALARQILQTLKLQAEHDRENSK